MLDKLYKASVILIATVLLVVSLVVLLKPDTLLAQKTAPTSSLPNSSMYAIPESHEWDAIASNSHDNVNSFLLFTYSTKGRVKHGRAKMVSGANQIATPEELLHLKNNLYQSRVTIEGGGGTQEMCEIETTVSI